MSEERESVTFKKYSAFTFIKIIVFAWIVAFVMNTGSYSLVGFNKVMSKAIGLTSDLIQWCANCLPAG